LGTLEGFPNPPALWLRRAKPASANAVMGTKRSYEKLNIWLRDDRLCLAAFNARVLEGSF
jgi:hypothetical protein